MFLRVSRCFLVFLGMTERYGGGFPSGTYYRSMSQREGGFGTYYRSMSLSPSWGCAWVYGRGVAHECVDVVF